MIFSVISAEKQGSASPTLSLEFASLCLRNALLLLSPAPTQPEPGSHHGKHGSLGERADNNSPPAISQVNNQQLQTQVSVPVDFKLTVSEKFQAKVKQAILLFLEVFKSKYCTQLIPLS